MFLEAEEQKLMQTLHCLEDAMAVDAVVWGFKNNMQLISLWPYHCSLRFPARLFMTYPSCWFAKWDNFWSISIYTQYIFLYISIYTVVCPGFIAERALKMKGRTVRSSAVKHSWACKERSGQGRVKDSSSLNPSFISISSTKYIAFWGRKDMNRNIAGLQWWI